MELELLEDDSLFAPNPGGQTEFFEDWHSRYLAMAGGWYAGKTWAGARKLALLHVHNAFDEHGQPTFVGGLAVGQDYQLARTLNIPELQLAFDEMGLRWKFVSDRMKFWFEFPDLGTRNRPSTIRVRSADAPRKINGFTIGHAWGDEVARWPTNELDPTQDPLVQLRGRLRDPKAKILQAFFTFTHEGDATPVYRDFEEKPLPEHRLVRAGTFQNPHAKAFGESIRGSLTADLIGQYLDGNAASFKGGKVYGAFDKDVNVRPVELQDALPLQLSLDFNISPGMHGIVGQHNDAEDLLTAVHEFHARDMSTVQLLQAFKDWIATSGGWRWPELEIFGDPAGNARFEATGETCWQIVQQWLDHNLPEVYVRYCVPSAHPAVADRVNAVNCALRSIDGRVRYLINERCERLITDLRALKWEGNAIGKKDRKLSHASDADGYRVVWLMPVRKRDFGTMQVAKA